MAYLARLGVGDVAGADLATLRRLHRAHLERVPFENLSIHLGEPIVLDEDALVAKLVDRKRGGFCYELNGAFAWLLKALGYRVTYLEAGVFNGGQLGPPFDHMVLRVDLERPFLADVGFGRNFVEPVPFEPGVDWVDDAGTFRLVEAGEGVFDLLCDGEPQYRLSTAPRSLSEYEAMCRYHQTSASSHFTRKVVCSRLTAGGRITLSGRRLIVTEGGRSTERTFDDDGAWLGVYRAHFGIELAAPPTLPPA